MTFPGSLMLPQVDNSPVANNANNVVPDQYSDSESWALYNQLVDSSNQYNSAEAQASRDWNKMMRDTQVSSYMNQLRENGINPILALQSGYSGASYPSSATGQAYSGTAPFSNSSRVEAALIRALGSVVSSALSSAMKIAAS